MPRTPAAPHPLLKRRLLAVSMLLAFTATGPAQSADDQQRQVTDQMRADCRAEAEAGGLAGTELEAYIRDCINDLLTVEISNLEE